MTNPYPDLDPQQSQVLASLLAGETISAAAREHGLHRSTIHLWIRDDIRFSVALQLGRAQLQSQLFDTVQELAVAALDRIRQLLADPDTSPSVCLRAATLILEMAKPSIPSESIRQDVETDQILQQHVTSQAARQNSTPEEPGTFRYATPPPGRNAPCPCNSGRKYKHCCLDKPRSS